MELPHLGKHCSDDHCRKLDFLPVKCDGCSKIFCGEHYSYAGHNCPGAYRKNVQVPVCPLCSAPIPGKVDELPDIRVSRHIDNDCKSDTAQSRRKKVYSNRCSFGGCKAKEMIPILCDKCSLNYCLRHRHPQDHTCSKINDKSVGKAGQAALSRVTSTSSKGQSFTAQVSSAATSVANSLSNAVRFRSSSIQGNMTEDQALQMALQASLGQPTATAASAGNLSQEQEDFLLAQAIAESEREAAMAGGNSRNTRTRSQSNCDIS